LLHHDQRPDLDSLRGGRGGGEEQEVNRMDHLDTGRHPNDRAVAREGGIQHRERRRLGEIEQGRLTGEGRCQRLNAHARRESGLLGKPGVIAAVDEDQGDPVRRTDPIGVQLTGDWRRDRLDRGRPADFLDRRHRNNARGLVDCLRWRGRPAR